MIVSYLQARQSTMLPAGKGGRVMRKLLLMAGVIAGLVIAGCAYTAQNRLPEGIKTIDVGVFKNSTFYTNLESELTKSVIQKINLTPGVKVVNSGGDATLSGEIYQVRNVTTEYDGNDQPRTVQVTVSVRIQLYDNKNDHFIIENMELINTQNSSVAGRIHLDRSDNWAAARSAALSELASLIVRNLNTRW